MRSTVFSIVALTLLSAAARGQDEWAEKMFTAGTSHDFGTVPRGVQLFHQFKLTNIYSVPLEILSRPGCGCVTTESSPAILKPKQQGTIDVHMDAHKFMGDKSVVINVRVLGADNSGGQKFDCWAKLTVKANSRVDINLTPGQITFPPVLTGERPAPQSLDVEFFGSQDWQLTDVDKNGAPFEAAYKETSRRPGHAAYQLTVSPTSTLPPGPYRYQLLLKTNDPVNPVVPVLVEGSVQEAIRVVPDKVELGHIHVGEAITKMIMVKSRVPFRVVAVEGLGNGLTAELPEKASKVQVIKLRYQPTVEKKVHKQLLIKTDLEKQPELTLKVDEVTVADSQTTNTR